ncbi:MAG: hypothetical protein JW800_04715 [Candidatus Omnitrophica bacterium]|nr:hypothetical protein [Candidatus Omnitrophota bacterium]
MSDETAIQPHLLFSILCDDVRREDNGKFMLIGLFETIGAKKFPAIHPTLYIMNCWIGGLGTFRQKSRIVTKEGALITEDKESPFVLRDLKAKHRIIARFNNLKFDTAGEYAVEVLLNGELKVRYPLVVKNIPPSIAQK